MLQQLPVLSMIIFAPLLGLLAVLLVPKDKGRLLQAVSVTAALIPLLLSLSLYGSYSVNPDGSLYEENVRWGEFTLPAGGAEQEEGSALTLLLQYQVGVDGLSLPLSVTVSLAAAMAALASVYIKKRRKAYYGWLLLLECGLLGALLAKDLLLLFAFAQTVLAAMTFLVGIWGGDGKEKAAGNWLLVNGISSVLLLAALLLLVYSAGHGPEGGAGRIFSAGYEQLPGLAEPGRTGESAASGSTADFLTSNGWVLRCLLLLAFGLRIGLFPFHAWLVKACAAAPAPVAMLLGGGAVPVGAYGLIRLCFEAFPEQAKELSWIIGLIGVINWLYGAVLACRQQCLRMLIAYLTISQSGMVLMGLAAGNETGVTGAAFQTVSGGLIVSLLWLVAGAVEERTGTAKLPELGGLARPMPFLSGAYIAGAFAMLGLPGLSGFIGSLFTMLGLMENMPGLAIAACVGFIPIAAALLRGATRAMYGPVSDRYSGVRDARLIEAVPVIVLLAFIVLLGCYPSIVTDMLLSGSADWDRSLLTAGIGG